MSKAENTKRMSLISERAKKLYDGGKGKVKVWTKAISAAAKELKKEGKI